jgi:hypothetical protein
MGKNQVLVDAVGTTLEGDLLLPANTRGIVLFAERPDSSRPSLDDFVARQLSKAGLGSLHLNLLTTEEQNLDARIACFRFDIALLASRLVGATDWLAKQPTTGGLSLGYFAAGTRGAAALVAAVERSALVQALVTHEGRPDLAEQHLAKLAAATLFLVGGAEEPLLGLNRSSLEQVGATKKNFVFVPGGPHPFDKPGPLHELARLAVDWFAANLSAPGKPKS